MARRPEAAAAVARIRKLRPESLSVTPRADLPRMTTLLSPLSTTVLGNTLFRTARRTNHFS
jgi:hypothetical protein